MKSLVRRLSLLWGRIFAAGKLTGAEREQKSPAGKLAEKAGKGETTTASAKQEASVPRKVAEPCLCECPVGIRAFIAIQEDATPFNFTICKQEKIDAGTTTVFAYPTEPRKMKLPFQFPGDKMGMFQEGNALISYQLMVFYSQPRKTACCESIKTEFDGDVLFSGISKHATDHKEKVEGTLRVKTEDSLDTSASPGTEQCQVFFTGIYEKKATIPIQLPGWEDIQIIVKGTFKMMVITRKV